MTQTQYFLGANSPSGFYSLYSELSDPERINALYILKGGAGCGKSSLMRRVARHAQAAGLDTQLILCSGDPDSLDGVLLPEKGIAVVDGTAPHVVEANCPGAVETYVDLSRFYDHQALQPVKAELLAVTAEYKGHYKQAYRCLGAAGELRRNLTEAADSEELRQRLYKRARGIIGRELKRTGTGTGRIDRRFLSALTYRGALTLWDTVEAQASRVYELADSHGMAHHLLTPILTAALAAGHDAVACPDPMAPDRLAHLILPGLSLAFVTSTAEQPWPHRAYRRLRLDAMADPDERRASRPRLRFTRKVADALTGEGVAGLEQAKAAHDKLEALYNPHVDFQGVYDLADRLADQILAQ
ncbi:MAG: hypothetical protein ACI4OU_03565 [Candidatus Enterenecus sp.]